MCPFFLNIGNILKLISSLKSEGNRGSQQSFNIFLTHIYYLYILIFSPNRVTIYNEVLYSLQKGSDVTVEKLSICVIFGGVSSEHEVSLVSATTIINSLDKSKYDIHMIGITKDGVWRYFDRDTSEIVNFDAIADELPKAIISPDRADRGILLFADGAVSKIKVDAAIPAMHGKNGEDGTIQGLFELASIPYIGPKVIGSAICMDKCVAKIMFKEAGIPQAKWVEFRRGDDGEYDKSKIDDVEAKLGYPCFIKPSNAGSSVGISKAADRSELEKGLALAFEHDYKVLVEEAVNAREVESAVMGNENPVCAPILGEIVSGAEFYDYDDKYKNGVSQLLMPAPVDKETADKIRSYAIKAYKICECKGLSRVDFFVDKETGEIKLNEINTLPGFTSISMYPKLWAESGLPIGELLDKLIEYGLPK